MRAVTRRRADAAFEKKLALIRRLCEERPPDAQTQLAPLLGDASHFVASEAAKIVGELEIAALAPALEALFRRVHDGEQPDRGCAVAFAALGSLEMLGAPARDIFLLGSKMVRREPDGAAIVDVAIATRIRAVSALLDLDGDRALFHALSLFGDSEPEVRAGLARALGYLGTEAALAALYTKLLAGDTTEVLGACLSGLMVGDAARFFPIVAEYFDEDDDDLASLAALAIADRPTPQAFDALRAAVERFDAAPRLRTFLLAIALLRREDAETYLLAAVRSAPVAVAEHAIHALAIHRHRDHIAAAVREAVAERKSAQLRRAAAAFASAID